MSRRARYAGTSHTRIVSLLAHEAFPEFWDRLRRDRTRVAAMATRQTSAAIERVWSQLPEGAREVLESELSPTDLQTLLISLAQTRARRVRPAEALHRWKSDRFVRPAPIDPRVGFPRSKTGCGSSCGARRSLV
jgi:hypothetical protein